MGIIACERTASPDKAMFDRLDAALGGRRPVFVSVFASPALDLGAIQRACRERYPDACVVGSTTSGEFTEAGDGQKTAAIFALAGDYVAHGGLGAGLGASPARAVESALGDRPRRVDGYPHQAAIMLLDPLAGHGEEAALLLAGSLGDVPLVGGAAGDDLAMTKTLVGLGDRVASDAVAVVTLHAKEPFGVGVCHGHAPCSTPLTATRVDGSVVLEVDGRPAWDVWREQTGDRARRAGLDPDGNPGAYLLRFEAGLRVGGGYKVRAPLAPRTGGGILFATPILEGTVFTIMESTPADQVESAVAAATAARAGLGGREVAGALVFDCICRKLILGDRYAEALADVSSELGGVPLAGFETYGEIALNSGDMSGFHNTTTVVLAFPRHG